MHLLIIILFWIPNYVEKEDRRATYRSTRQEYQEGCEDKYYHARVLDQLIECYNTNKSITVLLT